MNKILRSREVHITQSPPSKPLIKSRSNRISPPSPCTPPKSLEPPKKPSPPSISKSASQESNGPGTGSVTLRRSSRLKGKMDQDEQTPGTDLSSSLQFDDKDPTLNSNLNQDRVFTGEMGSNEVGPRRSTRLSEWKGLIRNDLGFDAHISGEKRKNEDLGGSSSPEKVQVLEKDEAYVSDSDSESVEVVDGMVGVLVPLLGGDGKDSGAVGSSSRRRSARLAVKIESDGSLPEGRNVEEGNEDDGAIKNVGDHENVPIARMKYNREEKGKGLVDLNLEPEEQQEVEIDMDPKGPADVVSEDDQDYREFMEAVDEESLRKENIKEDARRRVRSKATRRERFHSIARRNAYQFAHSRAEEEEGNVAQPTAEGGDGSLDVDDWPGPFSTAMKIIRDRAAKLNAPQTGTTTHGVSDNAPVIDWAPSRDPTQMRKKPVPALRDLCIDILHKNSEYIPSLLGVPNDLREKLTQMLCDSKKMGSYFMDLLVAGTPETVRVRDCSWMSEEQMTKTFKDCNKSKWSVLQLDLCGRCLPDIVLRETLAQSPKCLPTLVAISLLGACRITDSGLSLLVAAAPSLRSVNLSQCSLISSASIGTLADSLGLLLRELYLDNCQGIDAMLMLPALKRLKCLEVFSVADMQSVSDDFVCQFVIECGPNIKELDLANCEKLTDISVKAIADNCPALRALDLSNMRKLTDLAIGHIANGCSTVQKLQLCRNAFSDEALAAFLETSGGSLVDLSLNSVKKVGPHTAISLVRCCSKNLLSLDLSWCRNLTDVSLGYIVDGCLSLRMLKLFGCSQITNVFVNGHSNELVRIIGLKMSPVLEYLDKVIIQEGPLRYSSVP